MKYVPLTDSLLLATVDDHNYEWLSQYKWGVLYANNMVYARRTDHRSERLMHRLIMGVTSPLTLVDHINHNGLDNRDENLRIATSSQNALNRAGVNSNSSTGVRGVSYLTTRNLSKPYLAYVSENGVRKHLGSYATIEEAAIIVREWRKNHGQT